MDSIESSHRFGPRWNCVKTTSTFLELVCAADGKTLRHRRTTGIRVSTDTRIPPAPKQPDRFQSTWSCTLLTPSLPHLTVRVAACLRGKDLGSRQRSIFRAANAKPEMLYFEAKPLSRPTIRERRPGTKPNWAGLLWHCYSHHARTAPKTTENLLGDRRASSCHDRHGL